jgi:DMSO/TMAO reductase YedYZ molybdopterin-dependent catalytic subunit
MNRRELLQITGAAAVLAFARRALGDDTLIVRNSAPQDLETPLDLLDRVITPSDALFVRSHFGPPALDPARTISIEGMVDKPLTLGVDDLRAFREVSVTAVLECSGNGRSLMVPHVPGGQWGHGAMGQATWTGARLADVLAKAGVGAQAAHVQVSGADRPPKPTVPAFVRSIPLARALDPSTLIAYRMNGEPLPHAHGAPFRLVVPGWAGDHWMKWLTHVRVQAEEAQGFYMQTGYRYPTEPIAPGAAVPPEKMKPVTFLPVQSVIARPADGAKLAAGKQEVAGVAFAGDAAIRKVEVSLDGGATWAAAKLEGDSAPGRWQVFRYAFTAAAGTRTAIARATDANGKTQPEVPQWNPGGYLWNAWHRVTWVTA